MVNQFGKILKKLRIMEQDVKQSMEQDVKQSMESKNKTTIWSWQVFCKETYSSLDSLQDEIDECDDQITWSSDQILNMILTTNPKVWGDGDTEDKSIRGMVSDFKFHIDELIDNIRRKAELEEFASNWDKCHNDKGLCIDIYPEFIESSVENGDPAFMKLE